MDAGLFASHGNIPSPVVQQAQQIIPPVVAPPITSEETTPTSGETAPTSKETTPTSETTPSYETATTPNELELTTSFDSEAISTASKLYSNLHLLGLLVITTFQLLCNT